MGIGCPAHKMPLRLDERRRVLQPIDRIKALPKGGAQLVAGMGMA
ncbi:hypothetical protein RLEG12_09365 (plasmid) [Rhizobium leguminosarum bv. trifolii CB782]|nr:hypothetical protein RLEG12_09365 [Rhizobium leguminosarum bv. trifolii CB782]